MEAAVARELRGWGCTARATTRVCRLAVMRAVRAPHAVLFFELGSGWLDALPFTERRRGASVGQAVLDAESERVRAYDSSAARAATNGAYLSRLPLPVPPNSDSGGLRSHPTRFGLRFLSTATR